MYFVNTKLKNSRIFPLHKICYAHIRRYAAQIIRLYRLRKSFSGKLIMKKTVSLVPAIIMAACLASVIVSADVDPEIGINRIIVSTRLKPRRRRH